MNKTLIIAQREYLTRVRKKSFLIMTILGPLLLTALMVVPGLLATLPGDEKELLVLDKPSLIVPNKGSDDIRLKYLGPPDQFTLEQALEAFRASESHYALVYIPTGDNWDPDYISKNVAIYGQKDVSLEVKNYVRNLVRDAIQEEKLKAQGIDPTVIAQTQTEVNIKTFSLESGEKTKSMAEGKMALAFIASFLIYFAIFFYSSYVMRGVMEEKTNRIVEVLISTVKPTQLMMGKVIGVAGVGLTQFLVWIFLTGGLYLVATQVFFAEQFDPEKIAEMAKQTGETNLGFEAIQFFQSLNLPLILGSFLFYFLMGYLLYSAVFAAIGAAVDQETDAQQFVLPVTIPLILTIVTATRIIEYPDSPLAFWMSMLPLTSPLAMMMRIPFGVPAWELILSMVLMVAFYWGVIWLAGRVYRVGILMYGKKPSWKEIIKWVRYNP
jgi:ABC-2 type transport system permease protein